jgi:hypothetical protein
MQANIKLLFIHYNTGDWLPRETNSIASNVQFSLFHTNLFLRVFISLVYLMTMY